MSCDVTMLARSGAAAVATHLWDDVPVVEQRLVLLVRDRERVAHAEDGEHALLHVARVHDEDDRVDVVRRQPALDVAQHELPRRVAGPVGATKPRRGVGRGDDAVVVTDDGEPPHAHEVRDAAARIRAAPISSERRRQVGEVLDVLDLRDERLVLHLLEAHALAHAHEVADRLDEDGAFRHRAG